jgi:predicted dehydrogenase
MKIVVVGCGSIGQRHIANLKCIPEIDTIACRLKGDPELISRKFGIHAVSGIDDAIKERADAAIITTPTSTHVPLALRFAEAGVHQLIEKPISHELEGVDELLQFNEKKGLTCMVAYNLRFHPCIKEIKRQLDAAAIGNILFSRAEAGQYLPDWRPDTDYRESYSAKEELGGGVLLDLSHELDYMRHFMGEAREVYAVLDKISDLEIETEDVADLFIRYDDGVTANIHLDYLQHTTSRTFQVIGEDGMISCDLVSNKVELFAKGTGQWTSLYSNMNYDKNQMYIDELEHFIECISTDKQPAISGSDGKAVLGLVLSAKRSSKAKKVISV